MTPAFIRSLIHSPRSWRIVALCGWIVPLSIVMAGCGRSQADKALDSDANGYLCLACGTKFYTEREVFATFCPSCKKHGIEQVLGFVCPVDKHVTIGTRGRGAVACEKCGKGVTAVSIPREADLKGWGAAKKNGPEVGG